MNIYKDEWMVHAMKLRPVQQFADAYRDEMERQERMNTMDEIQRAINRTGRAIATGAAIAAMDGPIPILDMVGFGVAVGGATLAWFDLFFLDD
jgi:hypothetical protein